MSEEYYHKDLFGKVVDVNLSELGNEEEVLLTKKRSEFNVFSFTDALGKRNNGRVDSQNFSTS